MIVEIRKAESRDVVECRLQLVDCCEIVVIEDSVGLYPVELGRIAHEHGHATHVRARALLDDRPLLAQCRRDEMPALHHAEILIALGIRRNCAVERDIPESGFAQQLAERLTIIESLGVELIGDDTFFRMGDYFARNETLFVGAQLPLTTDEHLPVDPLPRAWLEIRSQPIAVGSVDEEATTGLEHAEDLAQHAEIILYAIEVAEAVAENHHGVERVGLVGNLTRIAFAELHTKLLAVRLFPRAFDEIARPIESFAAEAASRQFQRVPPLSAAEVEDAIVVGEME